MSQVSKYQLNNNVYEKIFSLFPLFLSRMTNKGKQNILVETFFSSTEKTMIAKRVAIAFMLVKDYRYDQIVDKLKVSHGTVAKIADALRTHDNVIKTELNLIASEQAFAQFLNAIGYQVSKLLPPKGGDWYVWRGNLEKEHRDSEEPF